MRSAVFTLSLLSALCFAASTAVAAPLQQVSWSIDGGIMAGGVTPQQNVASGSLSFTPLVPLTSGTASGTWAFTLLGTATGFFKGAWLGTAIVNTTSIFTPTQFATMGTMYSGNNSIVSTTAVAMFRAISPFNAMGSASWSLTGGSNFNGAWLAAGHIQAGSEVRTVVPEPTTGALLGLALVLVGVAGGGRRAARRARGCRR